MYQVSFFAGLQTLAKHCIAINEEALSSDQSKIRQLLSLADDNLSVRSCLLSSLLRLNVTEVREKVCMICRRLVNYPPPLNPRPVWYQFYGELPTHVNCIPVHYVTGNMSGEWWSPFIFNLIFIGDRFEMKSWPCCTFHQMSYGTNACAYTYVFVLDQVKNS